MELYATSIKNPYNRVFIFDRVLYEEISPLNPDCIFYLPLGTNVKSKDNIILSASSGECQKFSAEISFVGSLYTEKCAYDRLQNPPDYLNGYLNAIMDAQQKIYGYYFIENVLTDEIVKDFKAHFPYFYSFPAESYLTDKITLSQLYIGNKITAMERLETMKILSENFTTTIYTASDTSTLPYLHNKGLAKTITEMPIIFHESKININTTSKAIRSALPLRIWDILGSGGFVLSNYQEEIFTVVWTSWQTSAAITSPMTKNGKKLQKMDIKKSANITPMKSGLQSCFHWLFNKNGLKQKGL